MRENMADKDFMYISENENCTIVWQDCGEDSPWAERFYVPGYEGVLPFFISGEVDDLSTYMKTVGFQEIDLLKGILYGLYEFDYQTKPWHQKKNRETLLHLLNYLQQGFGYADREEMILNIANNVRKELGSATSSTILRVGNTLIPQSSKIKSDLVINLWEVICKKDKNDELFTAVVTLVLQIDFSEIKPFAKEIVCFYGLCALVFLNDTGSIENYIQVYITTNVKKAELREAIEGLLKNPENYSPEDLRVVSSEQED